MGLDCTHNAWHGTYQAFMCWRSKLAEVAGLPPLELMDGFFNDSTLYFGWPESSWVDKKEHLEELLPIRWECLKPSPLLELLNHSDCDGNIPANRCGLIADALEDIIPLLPEDNNEGYIDNWSEKTAQFVAGLRAAASAGEPLRFQ